MEQLELWKYIMAGMYTLAGLFHFIKPKAYLGIMPRYWPQPLFLVYLTGVLEIVFGIGLLFPLTQIMSAIGIIILLLLFLSVHIYMIQAPVYAKKIPKWILWVRLPLQGFLVYWAWLYV